MKKLAVAYIRVSSEEQVNNFSLENQTILCEEYCKKNGYAPPKIFREEGISAKSTNRKALLELLEYCATHKGMVDILLIYKIDRFARNALDYLTLKQRLASYGIMIVSLTEPIRQTPDGKLMELVMAGFAEFDNDIKSSRTKDGMLRRLEAGLPTNPTGPGYKYAPWKDEKNYPVRDDPNFTLLQKAGHEYLKGIYSQKQIAESLAKWGFTTKKGRKPTSQFVSKFLANPFYKGLIYSKVRNKYYKGIHEAMFTEEEWDKIQLIIQGKSFTAHPKKRNNPDYPLRHFAICHCGTPITGAPSKGRNKHYQYYSCQKHGPSIPTYTFESQFYDYLTLIKPTKETVDRFTKKLKEKYDLKYKDLTKDIVALENEKERLSDFRKALAKKNLCGVMDDAMYKTLDDETKDKLAVVDLQISEGKMDKLDIETICSFAEHFLLNLAQTWKNADLETKQRLQSIIFPEGVIYDNPGFRTTRLSCLFEVLKDYSVENDHLGWLTGLGHAS